MPNREWSKIGPTGMDRVRTLFAYGKNDMTALLVEGYLMGAM